MRKGQKGRWQANNILVYTVFSEKLGCAISQFPHGEKRNKMSQTDTAIKGSSYILHII
jgi:hypothetical protein